MCMYMLRLRAAQPDEVRLGQDEQSHVAQLGQDQSPQLVEWAERRPPVEVERDERAHRPRRAHCRSPRRERSDAEGRRDACDVQPLGRQQQRVPTESIAVDQAAKGRVVPLVVWPRSCAVVDYMHRADRRAVRRDHVRCGQLEARRCGRVDHDLAKRTCGQDRCPRRLLAHQRGGHRRVELRAAHCLHHQAGAGGKGRVVAGGGRHGLVGEHRLAKGDEV